MASECKHGLNFMCYLCSEAQRRMVDIKNREDTTVVFEDGKYYSLKNYIEKVMNKKREMKKFHCTHCGKSTIVEI